jgi:hypothetical protein
MVIIAATTPPPGPIAGLIDIEERVRNKSSEANGMSQATHETGLGAAVTTA